MAKSASPAVAAAVAPERAPERREVARWGHTIVVQEVADENGHLHETYAIDALSFDSMPAACTWAFDHRQDEPAAAPAAPAPTV